MSAAHPAAGPEARREADALARRRAQQELVRPLVLEAGAGTGKTATLVARILAYCLGAGWEEVREGLLARAEAVAGAAGGKPAEGELDPEAVASRLLDGVVAITFTEAAAAEMAERVGQALAAVERGQGVIGFEVGLLAPGGGELAGRARHLLAHLDRLQVATIHAFCRHLLAAHPLEAGLAPRFQVDAEGDLLDEVLREVLDDGLRRAYGDRPDADALALAAAGVGPDELARAARALFAAGVPGEALAADPWVGEAARDLLARIAGGARGIAAAAGPEARAALAAKKRNGARALAVISGCDALAEASAGEPGREAFLALARSRSAVEERGFQERLKDWAEGKLTGAEEACLGSEAAALSHHGRQLAGLLPLLRSLDPELFDASRRVLAPLVRGVAARLRSRGIVTFQDLLVHARDLLRDHPEICALERRRIRQLLVDEFQDTDRIQCDLVASLALEGPPEERPGLFLVGDPKQSIYGWRSADLGAYRDFVRRVVEAGGSVERLAVNFRSVPPVLAEVERLVSPVMVEEDGVQPPFEPLLPSPAKAGAAGFTAAGRRPVEHWVSWRAPGRGAGAETAKTGPGTRATAATAIEAEALARDLAALHRDEGVAWGEVGVLLRSAGDLEVYLRALQEAGVPYAVARDKSYYRRREVIDAAALVRAVLDPADHLALVTALRAPWVGVPDAALPRLWQRGLPGLATDLAGPDEEALARLGGMARAVARELQEELADKVPGLRALHGWEEALAAFFRALGELRLSFATDPADRFVETLRRALLAEAVEASRFLGPWRLANLDRFFRDLGAALDAGGEVETLLRALRRAVAEVREAREGRPREAAVDAVQVMTVHKAKGLDFRHVYLAQLAKEPRGRPDPRPTGAERLAGAWALQLLGAAGPGWGQVEERRRRVEAAERVRLLYVAATRAKDRLVLAGRASTRSVAPGEARSFADLVALRSPPGPDLEATFERLQGEGRAEETDGDGVRWLFPDLQPAAEPAAAAASKEGIAWPHEALLQVAGELEARGRAAELRQVRPFRAAASAEAHRLLEEVAEEREVARNRLRAPSGEGDREVALAVGTGVHRLFELFDLAAADPEGELDSRRRRLEGDLGASLEGAALDRARARAGELLASFRAGPLWQRFLRLQGQVLSREMPVLLPPEAGGDAPGAPVGFVAGTVDLLYRDPAGGELVIADYKTDAVVSAEELAERARAYAAQGRLYQRAVQEALGLPYQPRFELWFLAAGEVVEPPPSLTSS